MDFTALHQGVMLAATMVAGITFSIPSAFPANETTLTNPEIISSYNLPLESGSETKPLQNLNSLNQPLSDSLKLVVKEVQAEEVITVEQPPSVYTVIEPTPTPVPVPSPSPEEKSKTQEKKEEPTPEPSVTPTTLLTSSNADILFQMTNDHRAKIGKPSFEKDDRLCKIAAERAPQVDSELASGTLHKGFKALNLPYWATENLAAYQTMKENFNFLVTDYIHRIAIEGDHKYSCTACVGTSCSQIFSSFQPK